MPNGYSIGDPIIQVKNISLKLGGNQILRDLSFDILDILREGATTGQIVGLLGPSGIGKTQLFRILAGLNQPDSGEVLVGHPGAPVQRRMVGVVERRGSEIAELDGHASNVLGADEGAFKHAGSRASLRRFCEQCRSGLDEDSRPAAMAFEEVGVRLRVPVMCARFEKNTRCGRQVLLEGSVHVV